MGKLNKVDTLVTEGPEAPKGQGGVSDDIKERMKEFKEMNFSNLDVKNGKPDAISQKAIAQIKTEGNINPEHEGYDPEKAQDFEDFKEEYVERMNKHSTDRNSIAHKQTAIMTRRDLYGRIISPSVSGLSTAAQGIGQADKGAKDATAALNRTAGQMSGSNSQESGQQMSKAYDSLVQEISQVLEGIKQSGVVR